MTTQIKPHQGAITEVLAVFCGPLRGLPYIYLPSVSVSAVASRLLLDRFQSPSSSSGLHAPALQLLDLKSGSDCRRDSCAVDGCAGEIGQKFGRSLAKDFRELHPEDIRSQKSEDGQSGHCPGNSGVQILQHRLHEVADHHPIPGGNESLPLTVSSYSGVGLHFCHRCRAGAGVQVHDRLRRLRLRCNRIAPSGCRLGLVGLVSGIGFQDSPATVASANSTGRKYTNRPTAQTCHWHFLALPDAAAGTAASNQPVIGTVPLSGRLHAPLLTRGKAKVQGRLGTTRATPFLRASAEFDFRCEVCGAPLSNPAAGRPRRYCSDACRQKAHRIRRALKPA